MLSLLMDIAVHPPCGAWVYVQDLARCNPMVQSVSAFKKNGKRCAKTVEQNKSYKFLHPIQLLEVEIYLNIFSIDSTPQSRRLMFQGTREKRAEN